AKPAPPRQILFLTFLGSFADIGHYSLCLIGHSRQRAAAIADPRAHADIASQVVEAPLPHVAVAKHVDAIDAGRVDEEGALDTDAVRDSPHREILAQPAPGDADDDALEHLDALARALDHLGVNLDGVAGAERRHLCLLLLFL